MSAAALNDVHSEGPLGVPRLLAGVRADGGAVSLHSHLRRYGALPFDGRRPADDLHSLVAHAGLTGRGGAAFPVATKLEAVRGGRGRPVVVANGAEGEPASGKDKVLLAYTPHLVLDGAVLAARAVGAREAIVTTASRTATAAVVAAIGERRDAGVSLRVVTVPDRFIAGEETALVQFLNGGPCLPTLTPPRPFERGVGGAPTLVQNVETLAHVALIARFGPDWFRAIGTPDEPGSALVTLSGAVRRPGVYEFALGSPFSELLQEAGGTTAAVQAYLVGGYFGTWIDANDASTTRLSDAALEPYGASLGARAVVALPADTCGVAETARVAAYLAAESAGQCGPCVFGLAAVADDLNRLRNRLGHVDESLLRRRLGQIPGRGACRHPDGAVRLVAS
ncbi:MAG TPA: NADH-ubiquinone oxidoreductase-F iron-sulfur binding region domain-containing protein, partial [Gaiellaceae bacterium]|nr:NADH-ubiquinone oxidoreductase-F iron-sulfur binding region domain-containing protein [Gaiellaceae bacterium]